MQDLKRLRAACAERLRGITVPRPFNLAVFAGAVARHRGRPLRICPLPGQAGELSVSGAWAATDHDDRIFIEPAASPWHRDLIALHEISHMLCDHDADLHWADSLAAALLPDVGTGAVRRMLGRHGYPPGQEQEAEMMASLILERAGKDPLPSAPSSGDGELIARLSDALRHPVRHG